MQMVEDIGAYYWRRDRISGVQLRLPFVYSEAHGFAAMFKQFWAHVRQIYDEFVLKPESEQRALIEQVFAQRDAARAARLSEKPWDQRRPATGGPPKFDPLMALGMGYPDFWAIIGSEDAAQAFEKGATVSYEGSHPLYVCEDENALGMPSALLARLFFPQAAVTQPLEGVTNLVSFARAQQLIGFKPEHHVRDWLTAQEARHGLVQQALRSRSESRNGSSFAFALDDGCAVRSSRQRQAHHHVLAADFESEFFVERN